MTTETAPVETPEAAVPQAVEPIAAPPPSSAPPPPTTPPAPTVAPAPAPPPAHRRRDRILGTAGQVAGVLGIVVCLLLVVGVVFGRGWAVGAVDDVASSVDAQIAKTEPLLGQAHAVVGDVSGRVSTVADLAAAVAANPTPGGEIAQTLRTALANVSDRYQKLRQGYADVREKVVSLIDRLQTLDRLIPAFSVPQGPIDALATFDARLQEFDAKVTDLITIDPDQGPANRAAAAIATAATGIDTRLQGVQDSIDQVDQRITQLRADLSSTAGTVNTVITLSAGAVIILFLYLAFLHWVLFRHSGEIRRRGRAV